MCSNLGGPLSIGLQGQFRVDFPSNGDILKYNSKTNTFGVMDSQGNPTNMNNYNIGQLSRKAFANNARIDLYSCNSASLFGFGEKTFATTDAMIKAVDIGRSFAEQLSLQSGAMVTGVVGRTDYSPVISGQLPTLGGMGGPNSPSVRDRSSTIRLNFTPTRKK